MEVKKKVIFTYNENDQIIQVQLVGFKRKPLSVSGKQKPPVTSEESLQGVQGVVDKPSPDDPCAVSEG